MTDNYCVNANLIGRHFFNIEEGLEKQSVNGVKLKTILYVSLRIFIKKK